MADVSYVRRDIIPPGAPPSGQVGAIRWLRENLFATWPNAILTILCIAFLVGFAGQVLPWFTHAVWNANSLTECRQIIKDRWGEGASGACFAVIHERWKQFLFGFYPSDQHWRPTLAFAGLLVALAPVLASSLP